MKKIIVTCGYGGDYEFERDRFYWRCWISHHITEVDFDVVYHGNLKADEAEIHFLDDEDAAMFKLKRDHMYISFDEIKDTPMYKAAWVSTKGIATT